MSKQTKIQELIERLEHRPDPPTVPEQIEAVFSQFEAGTRTLPELKAWVHELAQSLCDAQAW
jgi:hypothetical protein